MAVNDGFYLAGIRFAVHHAFRGHVSFFDEPDDQCVAAKVEDMHHFTFEVDGALF